MTSTNSSNGQRDKTVLILGAAGRFGLAASRAFARAGWRVVAQVRPGRTLEKLPMINGVEWMTHDLDDTTGLSAQTGSAEVVINALNPAYCNLAWQRDSARLTLRAIEITRSLNATLMFPGNVYNFGSQLPEVLTETTPQQANDTKGKVRIAVEQQLAAAVAAGGLRAVVIRAGDYFGGGTGAWFDEVIGKDLWQGRMTYPGRIDLDHAWAYLPDLAVTFLRVAEKRAQLSAYDVLHFAGHTLTGKDWHEELSRVAQHLRWLPAGKSLRLKSLPWIALRAVAWVMPRLRATADMHHLWERSHRLDNTRLTTLIGDEPHTAMARATRATVAELYPHVLGSPSGLVGAMS